MAASALTMCYEREAALQAADAYFGCTLAPLLASLQNEAEQLD